MVSDFLNELIGIRLFDAARLRRNWLLLALTRQYLWKSASQGHPPPTESILNSALVPSAGSFVPINAILAFTWRIAIMDSTNRVGRTFSTW
jgi:hypothetical protein